MTISKIGIENFKSFSKFSVEMTNFNVIIGANASGKSNFILIFKFIKNTFLYSIEYAINEIGGAKYLKNIFNKDIDGNNISFSFTFVFDEPHICSFDNDTYFNNIKLNSIDFNFKLLLSLEDNDFSVIQENAVFDFIIVKKHSENQYIKKNLTLERNGNDAFFNFSDESDLKFKDIFKININNFKKNIDKRSLVVNDIAKIVFDFNLTETLFSNISIYEFEQNLLASIKNTENSDNINKDHFFYLINEILENTEKKRTFFNLLNYVLPDIEDIKLVKTKNKSIDIFIKERFNEEFIPSNLISDGTVFLIIIILALYFDKSYLTIFDEPERRIHPHLLSKLVDMMRDVTPEKQIILSTHNPEIVKYSGLENIFFVYRNNEGYSSLSKLSDRKDIKVFLQNEIGIDELFVRNMLKA